MTLDPVLSAWWWGMCTIGAANLLFLTCTLRSHPPRDQHERAIHRLCTVYVLGSLWRSVFPVLWESRPHACLFATPGMVAGGDLIDQLWSQMAESSLGLEAAWVYGRVLRTLGTPTTARLAHKAGWLILFVARPCCWLGCTTDNKLYHVFEESTWAAFAAIMLLAVCVGLISTRGLPRHRHAFFYASASLPVMAAYLYFMAVVDVPMYYNAWRDDTARGMQYASAWSGLLEMRFCSAVVTELEPWREALVWQSFYFGCFPGFAIMLARAQLPTGSELDLQESKKKH